MCRAIGVNENFDQKISIVLSFGDPGAWRIDSIDISGITRGLSEMNWKDVFAKTYMRHPRERVVSAQISGDYDVEAMYRKKFAKQIKIELDAE